MPGRNVGVFARATLAYAGISCRRVSVSPSVYPSVTSRCSTETAKRRIMHTTPHDSVGSLMPKMSEKLKQGHLEALNAGGVG